MNDRTWARVAVVVGALAGSAISAAAGAAASTGGSAAPPAISAAAAAAEPGGEPDRVAVVSAVLDSFETGSQAGPGVIGGIARTVIGSQPLPPPGDDAQGALLQVVLDLGAAMSENGPPSIDAFREAVGPLACANPAINAGLEAIADGFEQGAARFGESIEPFDLTAMETATFLRGLTAPEAGC